MTSSLRWPDAALAGLACSMRTFAAPGMLAARGRISGRPRIPVLLAETGEMALDKSSRATDRTDPPALIGRIAAGGYAGHEIAGGPGIAAGTIAAAVGTFATWRARGLVVATTGLPDPLVGVAEDILAVGIAAVATRPDAEPGEPTGDATGEATELATPTEQPSSRSSWLRDAGLGMLAGLAGTAAMTIAQGAEFALTDAEPSTAPAEIADQIKRRVGQGRLKRRHRRVANQAMHWLYGGSWGIPYGILAGSTDMAPELSGPVFGLLVWGAALAQEPALGLADPPWKRSLRSLGSEALFHIVYGVGAGAALRSLRRPR
jgi:hypothetical protein